MKRDLQLDIDLLEPPVAVLRLSGSVDTVTAQRLEEALEGVLDQGRDRLVVDMDDLDFMSTAGWSVLVAKLRRVRAGGGSLHLCRMSPDVDDVHKLLQFQALMPGHATLDAALAAVRAGATG
jgi:anti-sigma B factor antagonist